MNKKQTLVCKGTAIILMYIHHLFSNQEIIGNYGVDFVICETNTMVRIAQLCKCCVAIFVFLSAYGMTASYNQAGIDGKVKETTQFTVNRYLKLLSGFLFIYILALLVGCIPGGGIAASQFMVKIE